MPKKHAPEAELGFYDRPPKDDRQRAASQQQTKLRILRVLTPCTPQVLASVRIRDRLAVSLTLPVFMAQTDRQMLCININLYFYFYLESQETRKRRKKHECRGHTKSTNNKKTHICSICGTQHSLFVCMTQTHTGTLRKTHTHGHTHSNTRTRNTQGTHSCSCLFYIGTHAMSAGGSIYWLLVVGLCATQAEGPDFGCCFRNGLLILPFWLFCRCTLCGQKHNTQQAQQNIHARKKLCGSQAM